jgi:hypothetical protein
VSLREEQASTAAVDAVEKLLKRHIPRYSYSRALMGETRTDAVILADAAVRAHAVEHSTEGRGMSDDEQIYEADLIESLAVRKETRAEVWAREFMIAALRTPEMVKDAQTMLSVFAVAIQAGFERGRHYSVPSGIEPRSVTLAVAALEAQAPIAIAAGIHSSHFDAAIAQFRAAASTEGEG